MIKIQTPSGQDAHAIAELFLADMRDLGTLPDREAMRATTQEMLADDRTVVRVVRVGGELAGVIAASHFYSIKFPGRALWIEEVYIKPEFRRRGLARELVDHVLEWALREGFAGVELEAYRMNTAASILYRSIGFRRLARERYSLDLSEFELEDDLG